MPKHPENRGERNPLASRRLRRELLKNRFVPKKEKPRSLEPEKTLPPASSPSEQKNAVQ